MKSQLHSHPHSPQPSSPPRLLPSEKLPKFSSKYSFFSTRKPSQRKDLPQQIEECKMKERQYINLSSRFSRHRYPEIKSSPPPQIPEEIRKFRNSENLCSRKSRQKLAEIVKGRESEKEIKLPSSQVKRYLSISAKSVNKKPEIKELDAFAQYNNHRDSGYINRDKMRVKNSYSGNQLKTNVEIKRGSTYSSSKKIRDSRLRRERKSEIINVKKSISRCSQRPSTPQQQYRFEEQKTNQIEIQKQIEKQIQKQLHNQSQKQISKIQAIDSSYLMLIENVLANICEGIRADSVEVYELCLCYITLEKEEQQRQICSLFRQQPQTINLNTIRQYLILQRLVIYIVVYITKNKLKKKLKLSGLWELIVNTFKLHSIVTDLILEILVELNKLDKKDYKIKEMGKEKKVKQIGKFVVGIQNKLVEILDSKEDKMLELINSLFVNSIRIDNLQYISTIDKTLKWQILKLPTYPYLPNPIKPHSLILDLDQTLIHFNPKTMQLLIRPYAQQFIIKMAKLFQITIFTAGTKQYADDLIDQIDPTHAISFRLYRNHINVHQGSPIKNLDMLGRELKNVIIVDNLAENFRLQIENGILISTWEGDLEDVALEKLEYVLKNIVKLYSGDLRDGVKRCAGYIKENVSFTPLIYELKKDI